jgi:hypothetical protein
MAGRTPSACNGLVAVFPSRERFFIMAFVTKIRLAHVEKLFRLRLVRGVAGQTATLRNRLMDDPVGEHALIVTTIAESGRFCNKKVLEILRVRVVTGGAFPGHDRLVLKGSLIGDATPVMTSETELGHIECQ